MIPRAFERVARAAARLAAERRAVALTEFALVFPILLTIGVSGTELANYALVQLRVSQYALTLADNASRVGSTSNLSIQQLREGDVNDVLRGVYLSSQSINLTTYGRITLSSLENTRQSDGTYLQVIHWQRCLGVKAGGAGTTATGYESSYGTTDTADGTSTSAADAGTAAPAGIGDTGYKVNAPQGAAVMFVEINYQYQPIFGTLVLSPRKVHYTGAFPVRNNRDLTQLYNPGAGVTRSTCDRYVAMPPTS